MTVLRVLVFGAGPLGSVMAARLHEAGHDVSLLARGQRLDDLKNHGVVLQDEESGEQEVAHIPVVGSFDPDDHYDLVMVVMRKNQAQDLLPQLAANPHVPTYLFMMNNAEGPGPLVDAVGAERVLLGFPLPGGSRDGHVVHLVPVDEDHTYTVPIGEVDGQVRDRTWDVAELLGSMRQGWRRPRSTGSGLTPTHGPRPGPTVPATSPCAGAVWPSRYWLH